MPRELAMELAEQKIQRAHDAGIEDGLVRGFVRDLRPPATRN